MSEYNKLTPPEKRALRKYILNIFKRHNIKKLNNKTVPANKIEILIAEFEIKFKENPIISIIFLAINQIIDNKYIDNPCNVLKLKKGEKIIIFFDVNNIFFAFFYFFNVL